MVGDDYEKFNCNRETISFFIVLSLKVSHFIFFLRAMFTFEITGINHERSREIVVFQTESKKAFPILNVFLLM